MGALLGLGACSSAPGADPIAWWRQLEGGRLAEERPLPPNADAPYPNLASVPARPGATEAGQRARIAAGLEGDRRDAAFAAAQPITPPGVRRATPADPPGGSGMGASLSAASAAPAAPRAAPAPAPAAVAPAPDAASAPPPPPVAPPAAREALAGLPAAPPPPPRLPGVSGVTVPAPAPRTPAPASAPPAAFRPGAPVRVAFASGSGVLPEGAAESLRLLAGTRGGRDIQVVGHGESEASDAATQAGALGLAFARARGMATVLAQSGVPAGAIRLTAEAMGRGGIARVAE